MNIYGASGHAKVIIEIAHSLGITITDIVDDNPEIDLIAGYHVIHKVTHDFLKRETIFAIGDNKVRKKVVQGFRGLIHPALIHSSALISASAKIGEGSVIMPLSIINSEVSMGDHCILNSGAIVEHDCKVGNFVHLSPNSTVAGNVTIGDGTHIGIGAAVIPGVVIGEWATIGAGSVVIKDVPAGAVVVGNPARIIKYKDINDEK